MATAMRGLSYGFSIFLIAVVFPALVFADHASIGDISPRSFVANKKNQLMLIQGAGIQKGTEVTFGSGGPTGKVKPYQKSGWFQVKTPSLPSGLVDIIVRDPATGHEDRFSSRTDPITNEPLMVEFFAAGDSPAQAVAALRAAVEDRIGGQVNALLEGIGSNAGPIVEPFFENLTDPLALLDLLSGESDFLDSLFGHHFDLDLDTTPPTITTTVTGELDQISMTLVGGPKAIEAGLVAIRNADDSGGFFVSVHADYKDSSTERIDFVVVVDGVPIIDLRKLTVGFLTNMFFDVRQGVIGSHFMGRANVSLKIRGVSFNSDDIPSKVSLAPKLVFFLSGSDTAGNSMPIFTLTGSGKITLSEFDEELRQGTASSKFSLKSKGGQSYFRGTPAGILTGSFKNKLKSANVLFEDFFAQFLEMPGELELLYSDNTKMTF